ACTCAPPPNEANAGQATPPAKPTKTLRRDTWRPAATLATDQSFKMGLAAPLRRGERSPTWLEYRRSGNDERFVTVSAFREATLLHPVIGRIKQVWRISLCVSVADEPAVKFVGADVLLCDRDDVVGVPSEIGVYQIDGLIEHLEVFVEIERSEIGRYHLSPAVERQSDDMSALLQRQADKGLHD